MVEDNIGVGENVQAVTDSLETRNQMNKNSLFLSLSLSLSLSFPALALSTWLEPSTLAIWDECSTTLLFSLSENKNLDRMNPAKGQKSLGVKWY